MAENLVSQPPLMIPMLDQGGRLSKAWSIWFRDLYKRVGYKGGNAIDFNLELIRSITSSIEVVDEKVNVNTVNIASNTENIATNLLAIVENALAISILEPDPREVLADTTAAQYEFLSVVCSTVDITVTLPDASLTPGASIWINKKDATAFKVLTSVKDIFFQGTTLHLMSNGIDWIPS